MALVKGLQQTHCCCLLLSGELVATPGEERVLSFGNVEIVPEKGEEKQNVGELVVARGFASVIKHRGEEVGGGVWVWTNSDKDERQVRSGWTRVAVHLSTSIVERMMGRKGPGGRTRLCICQQAW
eukprot:1161707-Pelagomonas_calceolata.AAC.5